NPGAGGIDAPETCMPRNEEHRRHEDGHDDREEPLPTVEVSTRPVTRSFVASGMPRCASRNGVTINLSMCCTLATVAQHAGEQCSLSTVRGDFTKTDGHRRGGCDRFLGRNHDGHGCGWVVGWLLHGAVPHRQPSPGGANKCPGIEWQVSLVP